MRRRTITLAALFGAALFVAAVAPGTSAGAGPALARHAAAGAARPTLSLGAQGPAVRGLQESLRALGARVGVDGRFGPATREAVVAVQAARGLATDGVVGPRTWQALAGGGGASPAATSAGRPTLRLGSSGPAVADAQKLLTRAGQRTAADGRFGPSTARAAAAFQRARGLAVDGLVGPATWRALASGQPVSIALSRVAAPGPWRAFGSRTFTVRPGDTLASIAADTDSTASALATANRVSARDRPRPGSTLQVPGAWRCIVPGSIFINDWGFERPAGRTHQGNDLFARRGTPVVAPVAGLVERREGGLGGLAASLHGTDGNRYYFGHLDRYGAAGQVRAGSVIGYVGNSGNAVATPPHVHFEIAPGGGAAVNPFPTITLACKR